MDFIDDLDRYFAIANILPDRQEVIFPTLLKEPAKSIYRTTGPTFAARPAADAAAPVIAANQLARIEAIKTWLRAQFFGEVVKQAITEKIREAHQTENESPQQFYQRLQLLMANSAIPDDHQQYVTENQYMNGLQCCRSIPRKDARPNHRFREQTVACAKLLADPP